jgi:hypothetical protein
MQDMIASECFCFLRPVVFHIPQAWQEPALFFVCATSVFLVDLRFWNGKVNVWMSVGSLHEGVN